MTLQHWTTNLWVSKWSRRWCSHIWRRGIRPIWQFLYLSWSTWVSTEIKDICLWHSSYRQADSLSQSKLWNSRTQAICSRWRKENSWQWPDGEKKRQVNVLSTANTTGNMQITQKGAEKSTRYDVSKANCNPGLHWELWHCWQKRPAPILLWDRQQGQVGDTMVGRRNAGWTTSKIVLPAYATTAHKGLMQKRLKEDLWWIIPYGPSTTQSVKGLNWTVLLAFCILVCFYFL